MINLIPATYADAIRYGRQNTVLRKWLFGGACAIAGLIIITLSGWVYLDEQAKNLQKNLNMTNQQLSTQNLAQVQKDAKEITGDIKVINKVLSQEVRFSELIQAIGSDMPPGTVLASLSLSNKVNGAIDLSASGKDYTSITQIPINLSDPNNQLFSKVDVVNVSCSTAATTAYKCTSTLRALFSKQAQTKFLNAAVGTKP